MARARPDDWVYDQYVSLVKQDASRKADSRYLQDWLESGSELEAMRRAVARSGISLDPPERWIDVHSPFSDERMRADAKYDGEQAK